MVTDIYLTDLQLNKVNSTDTEVAFLDLLSLICNGFVSTKIYDKHDDFDFDIVDFLFLGGDIPRAPSVSALFVWSFD